MLSTSGDRSDGVVLQAATVTGDIYVFLLPEEGAESVVFLLDGEEHQRERLVPWDFPGGGDATAFAFDATAIVNGSHSITALVADG